jgi:hypothetical protein
MASKTQLEAAQARVLGLASHLRAEALQTIKKQPVYDAAFYSTLELPPAKDDKFLIGTELASKSKLGRKLRVICAGAGGVFELATVPEPLLTRSNALEATGITMVRDFYKNSLYEHMDLTLYEALKTHGGTCEFSSGRPLSNCSDFSSSSLIVTSRVLPHVSGLCM